MTVAAENLRDARILNWQLSPGDKKQLHLDLTQIILDGIATADGTRPAIEFMRAIPKDDRRIIVVVWHRRAASSSLVQESVSVP